MKILRIDREAGIWPEEAREALGRDVVCQLPVETVADSAVNRNDRPVFVPDFALEEGWRLDILPVIHIGHQGKTVAARFAHRYISGLSLAAQLHPARTPWQGIYGAIDTSLTVGPVMSWQPIMEWRHPAALAEARGPHKNNCLQDERVTGEPGMERRFLTAGQTAGQMLKVAVDYAPQPGSKHPFEPIHKEATVSADDLKVAETVELLSRFITLKTGDLLIPCSVGISLPLHLDAALSATIGEGENVAAPLLLRLK